MVRVLPHHPLHLQDGTFLPLLGLGDPSASETRVGGGWVWWARVPHGCWSFPPWPRGHRAHGGPAPRQSIQPAPTANLDRTDDTVYSNVMDLVRAVLQLKNEISLLPPEGYILVVKVGRAGGGQRQGCPEQGGGSWESVR